MGLPLPVEKTAIETHRLFDKENVPGGAICNDYADIILRIHNLVSLKRSNCKQW